MTVDTRAAILTRRTYNRPKNNEGTEFETWSETVDRVIGHQQWLWQRALGKNLTRVQLNELDELRVLMNERKVLTSGRTLWLGGTEVSRTREASQFNCAYEDVQTIHDVVDSIWLLLQGCGVGFTGIVGVLNGFSTPKEIEVIRSTRTGKGGLENNVEQIYTDANQAKVWKITVGDSAEAWAKAFGKLLAGKNTCTKLVFDLSQIRPAGDRLKGYGWISSGDESLATALQAIAKILNKRVDVLLTRIDLLDVENWLGTVLSSRRSAEIALHKFGDPDWEEFASAKKDAWIDNPQRAQSNNSLVFYEQPSKLELRGLFQMMLDAGGSEPGFVNGASALKRAPWFKGGNPCFEILLGNHNFCNLVETNLAAFNGKPSQLHRAHWIIARANYRQTCVDLRDGILQDTWHELNEFLRLCGVGVTGIVRWEHQADPSQWKKLRGVAHSGCNSMADELGTPRAKAITTIKPSGSLSKIMGTSEGIHRPLSRYIFNNINFSKHDPLVTLLTEANYTVIPNPLDNDAVIITFPVEWSDIDFTEVVKPNGMVLHVNLETAVEQLERYKMVMENYVDHNCSITVSYSPEEVPAIVDWLHLNWDVYVGVAWLLRADPLKTAQDLGYPYLPQDAVKKETYDAYLAKLKPIDIDRANSHDMIQGEECSTGACPIR